MSLYYFITRITVFIYFVIVQMNAVNFFSSSQNMQLWVGGQSMNDELEKMWLDIVVQKSDPDMKKNT